MTNTAGGQRATEGREDVLEQYVAFYSRVWSEGDVRVCEDTQLMERAVQVVLTPSEADHTFTLLPFYPTVIGTMGTNPDSSSVLLRLRKAFEVLELFCVNLFLYPWKKEIKTLKKFTGHFVYYIKAVLPLQTIRTVLHRIGYDSETDTEYKLSGNLDPNQAKEMGFQLFLARIECDHLIQITSQTTHAEGLEIIRNRGSAATRQEEPELCSVPNGVLEEDGARRDEEPSLKPSDVEVSESQNPEPGTFLSEDNSILEMQKDYPDLAFRLRPIFKSSSVQVKRSGERDAKFSRETSGPRSITLHTKAPEPAVEPCTSEEEPLPVGASSHTPGLTHADGVSVTDLAQTMMDKLKLKECSAEEPLKCPVEETVPCEKSIFIPNHRSVSAPTPPAGQQENWHHPGSRAGADLNRAEPDRTEPSRADPSRAPDV